MRGVQKKPEVMLAGQSLVEHPFGTLKSLDPFESLADEAPIGSEHRDLPANPGLQHDTSDQPGRNKKNPGHHRTLSVFELLLKQRQLANSICNRSGRHIRWHG